jgi:hypothetical protein
MCHSTYQIQNGDLHHTLVEVCCPVFDNLDCNHLLGLEILTFNHLSECTLTKHVEDQVTVLVPGLL